MWKEFLFPSPSKEASPRILEHNPGPRSSRPPAKYKFCRGQWDLGGRGSARLGEAVPSTMSRQPWGLGDYMHKCMCASMSVHLLCAYKHSVCLCASKNMLGNVPACVHVCACVYVCTCVHVCLLYACMPACLCARVCACLLCAHVCACGHVCVCACLCAHVCACLLCALVCACTCVYTLECTRPSRTSSDS